jgi:hypothetical protein
MTIDTQIRPLLERLPFDAALLDRLRNAERAFVVGMGPSLGKLNLESLDDELVFGVNHAAAAGIRHDVLFLADDRRVGPELRAGAVPIVTIDTCLDADRELFATTPHYGDIRAVNYAKKIPDILAVQRYEPGLPVAYWTGSVITDLVVPFAVECGIKELVCVGMDGLSGSFPLTHAWGTDLLTLRLDREAGSNEPGNLPGNELVAHMQDRVARLALDQGTHVVNATPGGVVESFDRAPAAAVHAGLWRDEVMSRQVVGSHLAIGTSVFACDGWSDEQLMRLRLVTEIGTHASNADLDGVELIAEPGFVGGPTVALRSALTGRYLTTRSGIDRFVERSVTESFNTALSSFLVGMTEIEATSVANAVAGLARADRLRREAAEAIRVAYTEHGRV